MKFIPNSSMKTDMISTIGYHHVDELFSDIPKKIFIKNLKLPLGKSQQDVEILLKKISLKNKSFNDLPLFLGGGIKPHYIPAAVKSIIARSEFYTAYTPYQAEASQGFLQAMFEYQSLICEITGMDVANASLYDGATALGEAALMAKRITKKNHILVPTNISWEKRSVLRNYAHGVGMQQKEIPYHSKMGIISPAAVEDAINNNTAAVYIENPNYFGLFEDKIKQIAQITHEHNTIFITGFDPITLGIIQSPGDYGADIAIGEGRALGNPMDFGGSGLGLFSCKKEFLRHLPGRIIGMTEDAEGKKAFCMTLQTREQHIRRGRATSNICTNEGLNALAALVYLSLLGQHGLYQLGKKNLDKAGDIATKIWNLPQYSRVFSGIHFNEFIVKCSDAKKTNQHLLNNGIQGGILLGDTFPELTNCMLFGVTEYHTKEQCEQFLNILKNGDT